MGVRDGAGSAIHAALPPPARSNELSNGPISSQLTSRADRAALGRTAEKSGAKNGLASCRETTDRGTTPGVAAGRSTGGACSATVSMPALLSMSRLTERASSETTASSSRSANNAASRTAIFASDVAMPSRRLSCSGRRVGPPVAPARARARSSRSSNATAWNVARVVADGLPRRSAASTSRTALAHTDSTSSHRPP
jgi:hypothetical protein